MDMKTLYLSIMAVLMMFIVGCTHYQHDVEMTDTHNYESVRKIAWEYIEKQGWDSTAKEDWKGAEVKRIIVENSYELLDKKYVGKEVLAILFADEENVVVSTPIVLVAPDASEVIGYIAGE